MSLENTIITVTPATKCDPNIAIAAQRAGAIGILDLCFSYGAEPSERLTALDKLIKLVSEEGKWGLRCELVESYTSCKKALTMLTSEKPYVLLLAGSTPEKFTKIVKTYKKLSQYLIYETTNISDAMDAQSAGFDGVILKGNESGGLIGTQSSFIQTQDLSGKLEIPYWVQGGIGPHNAAALRVAGATGVVLCEQTWLTLESPFSSKQQSIWESCDGGETELIHSGKEIFRILKPHYAERIQECDILSTKADKTYPISQDIAFASFHKKHYGTVGRIITAYQECMKTVPQLAVKQNILSSGSSLANAHGTLLPIVQGPMSRVSDTAEFAHSVAQEGALAFLALSVIRGKQLQELLTKTHKLLGTASWGVGILGFLPKEIRDEQLEAITKIKPPFALISGGTPKQANDLEALGIKTYLHVPSPGLLKIFIGQGIRKFIFEGSECGGHTGPRSSLLLWEQITQILLDEDIKDPENIHILFAGGIHDDLSAAMVASIAVPLVEKGMKCGVLMGSAYLMTPDAVKAGAILREFQQQALRCKQTILLESGIGHSNRCADTSFADDFLHLKKKLQKDKQAPEIILEELEKLNLGRLRLATKGVLRQKDEKSSKTKSTYVKVKRDIQKKEGMYMVGEIATLHSKAFSISDLHLNVTQEANRRLQEYVLQEKPDMSKKHEHIFDRNIAVVGMSCILPGAQNISEYWNNIVHGTNLVDEVTAERWDQNDFYDSNRLKADKIYSKWGAFLEDYPFDATKYGIPPNSLKSIEPIQLLALESARLALEDAGFDHLPFDRENTAVVFGAGGMHDLGIDYIFRTMLQHYLPKVSSLSKQQQEKIISELHNNELPEWNEDSFPGVLGNVVAGRIANRLDLTGSNYTVDAACGSSLAALDVAIHKLRAGTADVVVAGAADGTNNAPSYMAFSKVQAFSPRGRSRPFDESADGIAIGEGVVTFVLKRLNDAERDGDKIYAVIKGIGCSSDGRNKSLTAPHPKGQVRAIKRAYEDAGVSPDTVGLIEAHGTGTIVGDKSEIESLNLAFGNNKNTSQYCALGSVKSMIGHTKVAAGFAGMAKSILALHHKILPSSIGVKKPNTHVDLKKSPFYINTETRPWLKSESSENSNFRRRCGVSAFGFGGTNFHTVIEEYDSSCQKTNLPNMMPKGVEIILFSSQSREKLVSTLEQLLNDLNYPECIEFSQLAYTIHLTNFNNQEKSGRCRLAIVSTNIEEFILLVEKSLQTLIHKTSGEPNSGIYYYEGSKEEKLGKVAFLFPGQGAQKVNMLRDLLNSKAELYSNLEKANELLKTKLDGLLSDYIYPIPVFDNNELTLQQQALNNTQIAQPALAVTDLMAFDALSMYGFTADAVAGHSFGEFVALCVAGVISREDLYLIVEKRGRFSKQAKSAGKGTMAVTQTDSKQIEQLIRDMHLKISVANINSHDQTVVSGSASAIKEAIVQFKTVDVIAQVLPVTAPFHSREMDSVSKKLTYELEQIDFHQSHCKVYSNTLGKSYPDNPNEIRKILGRHIAEPVRFLDQIEQMYEDGVRTFIEVGPGQIQSGLVDKILATKPHTTLQLDDKKHPEMHQLAHLIGKSWVLGMDVNIHSWYEGRDLKPFSLKQLVEGAQKKANPSSLVWRVNCDKAVPWNQKEIIETNLKNGVSQTETIIKENKKAHSKALDHNQIIPINRERIMKQENDHQDGDGQTNSHYALKIQESMAQLMELQREHQQATNRLISIQEQLIEPLLKTKNQSNSVFTEMSPVVETPVTSSVYSKSETNNSHNVGSPASPPLGPIIVKPTMPTTTNSNNIEVASINSKAPSSSLTSSDDFKTALLEAVSERTGYPIDMLDLDALMEADLGIDSIKRVEIFSALEGHQGLLQGTSEVSLLEELADLKTLNKIINWYETNKERANDQETAIKKL